MTEANHDEKSILGDTILWRSLVWPGYEACRSFSRGARRHLEGTAVFAFEMKPCSMHYHIVCDASWRTLSATIKGWVGGKIVDLKIRTDAGEHWWLNEAEAADVLGCRDLDLNFSPSTNTIAIQRIKLAIGEQKDLTAAWLRFPGFTLEPLRQTYHRLEENLYRYESGEGRFVANLVTDELGFVTDYPEIWIKETRMD